MAVLTDLTTLAAVEQMQVLLRIGICGTFLGHGFIAANKLEFGSWGKFMKAAGFRTSEMHTLMPLIGVMDVVLAVITLVRPMQLLTAWMVVWAFSTAVIRPFSAGLARTLSPMSDNALWGFVERSANWVCPLALLVLQTDAAYKRVDLYPFDFRFPPLDHVGPHLVGVEAALNGYSMDTLLQYMGCALLVVWALVPMLRSRQPESSWFREQTEDEAAEDNEDEGEGNSTDNEDEEDYAEVDETGVVNVDETETGVVTTEMLYSTEDVEGFSRRELQAACKKHGLKASGKSDALREQLLDVMA